MNLLVAYTSYFCNTSFTPIFQIVTSHSAQLEKDNVREVKEILSSIRPSISLELMVNNIPEVSRFLRVSYLIVIHYLSNHMSTISCSFFLHEIPSSFR